MTDKSPMQPENMSAELCFAWPIPTRENWGEHYWHVSRYWPNEIKSCKVLRDQFAALLAKLSTEKVRNRESLLGLWNTSKLEHVWLYTINAATYHAMVCDYPADDVEHAVRALHDVVSFARVTIPAEYPALNRWMWRAYCITCNELAEKNKLRCPRCGKSRNDKGGEIDEICEIIRGAMRDTERHHMLSRQACIRLIAHTICRKNNVEAARQKIKKEKREAEQRFALKKLPVDAGDALKQMTHEQRERHNRSVPLPWHLLSDRLNLLDEFTAIFHK